MLIFIISKVSERRTPDTITNKFIYLIVYIHKMDDLKDICGYPLYYIE